MPSLLPSTDAFAYGSPSYGANVTGYVGFRPTSDYDDGLLVRSVEVGARAWGLGLQAIATNADDPIGFVRRQAFAENVVVTGTFKFVAVEGEPSRDDGRTLGVVARATGGTLADDGDVGVSIQDGTAYGALLVRTGFEAYSAKIVRWASGVETEIDSLALTLQGDTLHKKALGLRLSVSTNTSGNVDLKLETRDLHAATFTPSVPPRGTTFMGSGSSGQVFEPTGAWVEIVSATDSSGSKITGGGRCGFVMERERERMGGVHRIVTGLSSFIVRTDAGELLLSDSFARAQWRGGYTATDAWGTSAMCVQGDFTNDQHDEAQDADEILQRDGSAEAATHQRGSNVGNAVDLTPSTLDHLTLDLSEPLYVQAIPDRDETAFSLSVWLDLDATPTGSVPVFDNFLDIGNGTSIGLTLGIKPGGAGSTYRMFATVSSENSGSGSTLETADIADSELSGGRCFAWTISSADARVRFYSGGTLSVERALGTHLPELRGASSTVVGWNGTAGGTVANYLDGRVDELQIHLAELDANQIAHLGIDSGVGAIYPAQLLARWGFENEEFTDGGFATTGTVLGSQGGSFTATLQGSASTTTGVANEAFGRTYFATTRPVDSLTTQHRIVEAAAANANSRPGVFVRGGIDSTGQLTTGYLAELLMDPGGGVYLYRVNAGVLTLIGWGDHRLVAGTGYDLGLSVAPSVTADESSPTLLEVTVDGSQIALEAQVSSVTADSSGTIRDTAPGRPLSGAREGFSTWTPGGAYATTFDNWRQSALGSPIFALSGPSVPIRSETTGAIGALDEVLLAGDVLVGTLRDLTAPTYVKAYESGHSARLLRAVAGRRAFQVRALTQSITAWRTFWDTRRGKEIPFTFSPEGESSGVFSFIGDSYRATPVGRPDENTWLLEFQIIERIPPYPFTGNLTPPFTVPGVRGSWDANGGAFSTSGTGADTQITKTPAGVGDDCDRWYSGGSIFPTVATTAQLGVHLDSVNSAGSPWAVQEFASASVINGKRTLEPRRSVLIVAFNGVPITFLAPYDNGAGFTFLLHAIPPGSGYTNSHPILRLTASGGAEILRFGWSSMQFYEVAGVVTAAGADSGSYDFTADNTAKLIGCRWTPGSTVEVFEAGSLADESAGTLSTFPTALPAGQQYIQTPATESTSLQADSAIGTKAFVQALAFWARGLEDEEINGIGRYWANLYGSTYTDL